MSNNKIITISLTTLVVLTILSLNITTLTFFILWGGSEDHTLIEGDCYNLPCAYHTSQNVTCVYQLGYNYYLNRSLDCPYGKRKLTCCFIEDKLNISFTLWYALLIITGIFDFLFLGLLSVMGH